MQGPDPISSRYARLNKQAGPGMIILIINYSHSRIVGIYIKFAMHVRPVGSILLNSVSGVTRRRHHHGLR